MVKISDVLLLLKYHYNTDKIDLIQITDRNGDDIQIWQDVPKKWRGPRPPIMDFRIEYDCLLTFIKDDDYEDCQLDDIIMENLALLMREAKLKNLLDYEN